MSAPHVLGIDDGPFDRHRDRDTLVVGIVTAGPALVEGVLTTRLLIDDASATEHLAGWIEGCRVRPLLRAVFLDGITIAGLAVIDLPLLAEHTGLAVIATTREQPATDGLERALRTAGYTERIAAVQNAGVSSPCDEIHLQHAGVTAAEAIRLVRDQRGRSRLPECLRLAHLIAAGVCRGESRGS